jgi:hypothetical protein
MGPRRILSASEVACGRCRKCHTGLVVQVGDSQFTVASAKSAESLRKGLRALWWVLGGLALMFKAALGIPWAFVIVALTIGVVGFAVDLLCFGGQGMVTVGQPSGGSLVCPKCGAWKTKVED